MYDQYITIDSENRIIDGFTTAQRQPGDGDIYLHSGGPVFELFGKDAGRLLYTQVESVKIWLYSYTDGRVRYRTKAELVGDMPVIEPVPTADERLKSAEEDIKTLGDTLLVMLGVLD